MYIEVKSKDKAPPGELVGPYVLFFRHFLLFSMRDTCPLIQTFCASPKGVLKELTVVCATPFECSFLQTFKKNLLGLRFCH